MQSRTLALDAGKSYSEIKEGLCTSQPTSLRDGGRQSCIRVTSYPYSQGLNVAGRNREPRNAILQSSLAGFAHVRRCSVQVNLIGQEFREPLRREHDETSTWERQRFDAGQSSGWRAWDD
jgi:hypothetical protein